MAAACEAAQGATPVSNYFDRPNGGEHDSRACSEYVMGGRGQSSVASSCGTTPVAQAGDLGPSEVTPIPKPIRKAKDTLPMRVKPKPTTPGAVKDERAAWHAAVLAKRNSMIWTAEDYPVIAGGGRPRVHAHHILSKGECRKHGAPEWDPRNGMPVSERRHARHHSRLEPITRDELPDEIHAFLADHPALMPYFDRTYPEATAVAVARSAGGDK